MPNQVAAGFLSYARSDDKREEGRIARLAKKIMDEFEMITGSEIKIFLDREDILWGNSVRSTLNEALQETTFFIPVLTPTYFQRDECRNEMLDFVKGARALGLDELLMSIRYVEIPDLREDSTDELKAISAKMQYEDWTFLRLVEENSAQYRAGINKLAKRLVEVTHVLEERGSNIHPVSAEAKFDFTASATATLSARKIELEEFPDDAAGHLDLMADLMPALQSWADTMNAYGEALNPFNYEVTQATEDMNAANEQPNSFAVKLVRARQLAKDLDMPLQKIEQLSKDYSSDLMRLDPAVQAFIAAVEQALADERTEREAISALYSLHQMVRSALAGMDAADDSARSAKSNQNMSRDLRPIWRRFEASTRNITDARYIVENWNAQIARIASDCPPLQVAIALGDMPILEP